MAEANGGRMDLDSVREPETEIRDVHYWMDHLKNSIQQNQRTNEEIIRAFQEIESSIAEQERMNESTETQAENIEGFDPEKLSPTALKLTDATIGALSAEQFREFLMHKSYRKPFPPILPILRSFSHDVDGVKEQLKNYRKSLKRAHQEYKQERKKDENLERRIEKLITNITNELEKENKDGLRQTSMQNFL